MIASETVLELRDVTIGPATKEQTGMSGVNLRLRSGGLLLIRTEPGKEHLPLGDAVEGLVAADSGRITFMGEEWSAISPFRQSAMRGKIGRVFDGCGWLSNLDVGENVTLAERHRAKRAVDDINAEADRLARACGMDGLPSGRPAWVSRAELRRAEWVRAFLGNPVLVLLELPTQGVPREQVHCLVEVARAARTRGAAVLWSTVGSDIWERPELADAERYAMQGQQMILERRSGS